MISYQNHEHIKDESIVKALIRNQLKICSKLHFVNMIYKHLPVWNRADVIPYLKMTGIVVNPNLGSGEDFFYTGEVRTDNKQKSSNILCANGTQAVSEEQVTTLLWLSLLQQHPHEALQGTCSTDGTVTKDVCLYMPLAHCVCYTKKENKRVLEWNLTLHSKFKSTERADQLVFQYMLLWEQKKLRAQAYGEDEKCITSGQKGKGQEGEKNLS